MVKGQAGTAAVTEDGFVEKAVSKYGEKIAVVAVCEHEYTYALENRMGARPFDEYDTLDEHGCERKLPGVAHDAANSIDKEGVESHARCKTER